MEVKKQIGSITVNTRVPVPLFERLDAEVKSRKAKGENVSKNSLYVEALELFLNILEQSRVDAEEMM